MPAKQILIILPNLLGGGAERVALTLVRELSVRGYSITLFLFKSEGVYWSDVPDAVRIQSALPAGCRTRNHLVKVFLALLAEVRATDIVIAGLEGGPTILGYLASRLVGKPVIGWVHGSLDQIGNSLFNSLEQIPVRFVYSHLSAVVCVSEGALSSLHRFVGKRKPVWRSIPNPLQHLSVCSGDKVSNRKQPLLLAIGRLNNRQKGFDLLIRAHARLRREGLMQQLVILGEGPDRDKLEQLVREEGVSDTVILPGFVENVRRWYDQATVFVLSSRSEGLPTVLLEALACGTPVVATDCISGPREILNSGEFGELVEPESVDALVAGIWRVLNDKSYRETLAQIGPVRAADFSPEKIAGQWEELFNEVRKEIDICSRT